MRVISVHTLYKKKFTLTCYIHTNMPTKDKLNVQADKSNAN